MWQRYKEGQNDRRKQEQKEGNDEGLYYNHWKEKDEREQGRNPDLEN